jgi:hypothetical protein
MIEKGGFAWDISMLAHSSGSLANNQYFFVYSTGTVTMGNGYVGVCLSSTDGSGRALGVLQNDPAASQAATVRLMGFTKIATEAAVTAPCLITCSTAGTAATASSTGNHVLGFALSSSATTSGEIIDALLIPGGVINL